jgi:hypothetical protein
VLLMAICTCVHGQVDSATISLGLFQGVGLVRLVELPFSSASAPETHRIVPSSGLHFLTVGFLIHKKFRGGLGLRLMPYISMNDLDIKVDSLTPNGAFNLFPWTRIDLSYLHLPLCLQWTFARTAHLDFWVQGGPQPTFSLIKRNFLTNHLIGFSTFDCMLVAGTGARIKFPRFNIVPEIRFQQGFRPAIELTQNTSQRNAEPLFLQSWTFVITFL